MELFFSPEIGMDFHQKYLLYFIIKTVLNLKTRYC